MTIDIYTTPQCGFCKQLKAMLQEQRVPYIEHDVTRSEEALQEMQEITNGAMSVPVVVTNGGTPEQKYAVGFEEARKLLTSAPEGNTEGTASGGTANLTCPKCGHVQRAPIPTTACVPFYVCDGCRGTIKAAGEDCCVFCSFSDTPCSSSRLSIDKERAGAP